MHQFLHAVPTYDVINP
uniref:Uncharacterized protein n=1 Tax=Arundo donax TaxID=35708 RepID=A0A0A8Z6R6_ARUDO